MNAPAEILAGVLAWVPIAQHMPDDEETVLIFAPGADEPVWMGWHDADGWHYIDGGTAEGVTHWLPMPEGPR